MTETRATPEETQELTFGAQTLTFLPGSLAIARYRDPLRVEELNAINSAMGALRERTGDLFFVADLSGLTRMTAYRGRSMNELLRFGAVAIVGASFPLRVLASMVARAVRALKKGAYDYPVEFFPTEAEGLAWIRERMAERRHEEGGARS